MASFPRARCRQTGRRHGIDAPLSGISSDAPANLAAAIRVAAAHTSKSGVLVVLNDEIHSARRVAKGHTLRLNAFHSPWFGPIGYVDGTVVVPGLPEVADRKAVFSMEYLRKLPRVDIVYSYVGADGTAARSFVAAGAKGIVSAGFGPGLGTPEEIKAFGDAVAAGIVVVQSSRTGAGQVVDSAHHKALGIIAGSDLPPQKARILLALCLARGDSAFQIEEAFHSI